VRGAHPIFFRNQRERRQRVAPEIFDDKILHSENWIVIGGPDAEAILSMPRPRRQHIVIFGLGLADAIVLARLDALGFLRLVCFCGQGRSQDGNFFIVRGPTIQIYIKI
jgi:hypothetical protein